MANRMTSRGLFIVLEGVDGAGTTTIARALDAKLRTVLRVRAKAAPNALSTWLTREPTGGAFGAAVRQWFTEPGERPRDPRAMPLAFCLDRYRHVEEIEGMRDQGVHVLCDRYSLSTRTYQADVVPAPVLDWLLGGLPIPDVTLLLDLDLEEAARRRQGRGGAPDLYERDAPLQAAVRARYLAAAASGDPQLGRIVVIDANQPVAEVERAAWRVVRDLLDGRAVAGG